MNNLVYLDIVHTVQNVLYQPLFTSCRIRNDTWAKET